jgi:hypothetical protein
MALLELTFAGGEDSLLGRRFSVHRGRVSAATSSRCTLPQPNLHALWAKRLKLERSKTNMNSVTTSPTNFSLKVAIAERPGRR